MPTPPPAPLPSQRRLALVLGAFLLVLGVRLSVIGLCGAPVPYVDEWTAIGQRVLLPWKEGVLEWSALWSWHNGEHRLIASRALELALFIANGQWDPIAGMVVNAFAVAAMAALCVGAMRAVFMGAFLVALLWALPFGYANLLWPLQSHFYFLLLGTVLALREVSGIADAGRVRGWIVASSLTLAVLGSAGGFISALVVGAILVARVAAGRLPMRAAAGALGAVAAVAALGWMLAPTGAGAPAWDAALLTLLKGASWPLSNLVLLLSGGAASAHYLPAWLPIGSALAALGESGGLLLVVLAILASIAWAPFFTHALALLRDPSRRQSRDLFHFGLGAWVLAALAAIALKRATDFFVPTRYIDLVLPGIAVNGWIALQMSARWLRRLWLAVLGGGLLITIGGVAFTQLPRHAAESEAWMRHLSGYAQHRDIARLTDLAVGQLPNLGTDPTPLVAILDLPGYSAMLVPELRGEAPRHGPLGGAARLLIACGPLFAIGGLFLLLGGGRRRGAALSPASPSPPGPPSR